MGIDRDPVAEVVALAGGRTESPVPPVLVLTRKAASESGAAEASRGLDAAWDPIARAASWSLRRGLV
jgi:hypothetical protein